MYTVFSRIDPVDLILQRYLSLLVEVFFAGKDRDGRHGIKKVLGLARCIKTAAAKAGKHERDKNTETLISGMKQDQQYKKREILGNITLNFKQGGNRVDT